VIDHIVYGVPRRLAQAVAWFAGLTGAQPARGGSHEGMGTANFLIGLGAGAYLEIIGPDPDQPQPVGGRWFGIDRLTAPRIVTWAIRTADIDGSVTAARAFGLRPRPADNHDPAVRRRRRLAVAAHATANRTQRWTGAVPDRLGQHPAPNKP
jgi:hypothetical protein